MEIEKIFLVDSSGVIMNFISISNPASPFCSSCIIKRLSNPPFGSKKEYEETLKNCAASGGSEVIKTACSVAHYKLYEQ